ncbi:IS5 family transposase [Stenotrophomonas maltophilia]|uniref:IS5 family transposase n=1 Tax=Stenotrophomonas maltophilia TaxID=40324 RepID=UPI0006AC03A9|nr:IS5 family transposase [Stenotrophomonas maltophilia]KOQ67377.1 transposase [Stenotrophomonas maltophilia]
MQLTYGDAEGLGQRKQTRRERFLAEMDQVVLWKRLLALIEPDYPKTGRRGRQPYPLATMLRVHFLQQWYALSDPSMEEALYDTAVMRRFAGINGLARAPDETTTLNFRRLLETHGMTSELLSAVNAHLKRKGMSPGAGTIVDATIIHAPSSTNNADKSRNPEMHQTRKGNQWYFGMKAHIGVDEFSGLVRHAKCTAVNVGHVTVTRARLHGMEACILGDSGYTGTDSRPELKDCKAAFLIAKRRGKVKTIRNARERRYQERWETWKARLRAKFEHAFRVIKRQFGYTKVRYRGLVKNAAQVLTLFALCDLWMARRQLMPAQG